MPALPEASVGASDETALPVDAARTTRRDLLVLSAIALVLRLPAFFASAHLTFDDGVFGASAVAMRSGAVPFRDVFSSQGPAFLPLVFLGDLLGLRGDTSPRVLAVLSGLAVVVVVYLAGLELADRTRARLVGSLAAVTGSILAVTGPLAADGPAMALAAYSVLLALRYRRSPGLGRAVAIGAVLGLAIMVKAIVLPAAIPVGLILLGRRRWGEAAAAVGTAVAVGLVLSVAFGFSDVWDQSVVYHLDAPGTADWGANASKAVNTFATRDILLLAAAAVTVGAALLARRGGAHVPAAPSGRWTEPGLGVRIEVLLWAWLVAMVALLVVENPLWRPHVSELGPPLLFLIARYRPPVKPVLIAGLLVLPLYLSFASEFLVPDGYAGDEDTVVTALAALPDDVKAISDEPGQVWRSGHETPPDLVDASELRTKTGRITAATLADDAAADDVCAAVVWSSRFGDLEELPALLAEAGYDESERFDETRAIYLKRDCPRR